jgi:flagellar hook-length control protein FliK
MNNATLALNVARPVTPAAGGSATSASAKTADDGSSSSSQRFDAAMDDARAHARKTKDDDSQGSNTSSSATTSTSAATPASKSVKKPGDDVAKKDDDDKDKSDDTSIASTMLALIGVPPKVTAGAAKLLGVVKDAATGQIGDALGALLPGANGAAEAVAGAKDAALNPMTAGAATALVGTDAATTTASSFAAFLTAQGGALASKDDTSPSDPSGTSPMPLANTQTLGVVDSSAMQVQATQVATSPQFAQELGEQIAWMGTGEVKEARIKLHPEELGSMDVRVNMDGNKVNVAIIAQHPAAVHAVQQTLSQLDTLLAHHGLSLGQADVGQRGTGQGADGQGGSSAGQGSAGGDGSDAVGSVVATSAVSRGLVDEVA